MRIREPGAKAPATPRPLSPPPSTPLRRFPPDPARAPTPASASPSLNAQHPVRPRWALREERGESRAAAPRALAFRCRRRRGRGAGSQPFTNFKGRSPRPRAPPRGGITPCNSLSSTPPCGRIGNPRGRGGAGARRARGGTRVGRGFLGLGVPGCLPVSKALTPFGIHAPTSTLLLLPAVSRPRTTYPAWRGRVARGANSASPRAESPRPAALGARDRRSVLPEFAARCQAGRGREEMDSRKEKGCCGGGGRPAGSTHSHPQPPPHLCRSPRAPRGGAAVTSLHKPRQRLAAGEGRGPAETLVWSTGSGIAGH